jgi:predicted trehalose synthase
VATTGEASRRLGFDPQTVKGRRNLHADEPGKLNTRIDQIAPPGRSPMVTKRSSASVIRNELFLRKVIRRWFARYFDTPRSLVIPQGQESLMVMEFSDGQRSYVDTQLTLAQRAALAVLVHTFGLDDMNEGNVLYSADRVWLIDFEQALSRHQPNIRRLPDEGIAAEMPWLT